MSFAFSALKHVPASKPIYYVFIFDSQIIPCPLSCMSIDVYNFIHQIHNLISAECRKLISRCVINLCISFIVKWSILRKINHIETNESLTLSLFSCAQFACKVTNRKLSKEIHMPKKMSHWPSLRCLFYENKPKGISVMSLINILFIKTDTSVSNRWIGHLERGGGWTTRGVTSNTVRFVCRGYSNPVPINQWLITPLTITHMLQYSEVSEPTRDTTAMWLYHIQTEKETFWTFWMKFCLIFVRPNKRICGINKYNCNHNLSLLGANWS